MIFNKKQKKISVQQLPMYCDWAFDIDAGKLRTRGGRHYLEYGLPALKFWIYKTLLTQRGKYAVYDSDYGADFATVIGKMPDGVLASVIVSALQSPYIVSVGDFDIVRDGETAQVRFLVTTVYGDMEQEVMYGDI